MPTRRTHVVRIPSADTEPGKDPSTYVDVEVLDAISFRTTGGKEMVLDFAGGTIVPYIVDDTGDGNAQTPDSATRRSHMQRVTSDDGQNWADFEVLDCIAFRGENGQEWILNLPAEGDDDATNPESEANEYNTTTSTGDSKATRRVHNEKISTDLTKAKKPTDDYFTITRTDMVAFRTINGQEVIINMASSDDPLSSDPRADTHMTPSGYDPTDKTAGAVKPPLLKDTNDKNIYVYLPKNAGSITALKDKRIAQGPLWWIRSVSGGKAYIIITMTGHSSVSATTPPPPTFSVGSEDVPLIESEAPVTTQQFTPGAPSTQKFFFIWYEGADFPDATTVGNRVGEGVPYGGQFSTFINMNSGGFTNIFVPNSNSDGFYQSIEAAETGAAFLNNLIFENSPGPYTVTWLSSNTAGGTPVLGPAGWTGFVAGEVDIVTPGVGIGTSSSTQRFLLGPVPEGVDVGFNGSASIAGFGVAGMDATLVFNVGGDVKSFDDMIGGQTAAEGSATSGALASTYSGDAFFDPADDAVNSFVNVESSGGGGGAV